MYQLRWSFGRYPELNDEVAGEIFWTDPRFSRQRRTRASLSLPNDARIGTADEARATRTFGRSACGPESSLP